MKQTYIKPLFIMALLGLSATVHAQTDTDTAEVIEVPYPEEIIDEMPAEEGAYEAVPDFDYNQEFSYEEPKPKKYDFQTRFGFGFVSLNNALSPVAAGSNATGRFLPTTKFISSNISNFEISFGKNISQGLWRLWFGLGIEDEYFTFEDANVRLMARSDSFSHKTVEPTDADQFGKAEDANSSSFSIATVTVPLAIGYQNKQRRPDYKVQFGAYLGYRFQSQTDVKYADKTTVSVRGNFHTNPFIVDPFVNLQYKRIGLFARTSLLPILNKVGGGNEQTRNAFGLFIGM
jgi:hypothetical protein